MDFTLLCVCAWLLSCVQFLMKPWTVNCQAPLFIEFSRQEYWIWVPFPSPVDLPDPGIKPSSPAASVLAGGLFTFEPPGLTQVILLSLHLLLLILFFTFFFFSYDSTHIIFLMYSCCKIFYKLQVYNTVIHNFLRLYSIYSHHKIMIYSLSCCTIYP